MANAVECRYSPFCAKQGCELIAHLKNQANQSGAKTPEQAQSIKGLKQPGKIWLRRTWDTTVSNTLGRAPQLGCAKINDLRQFAQKITREKATRRELV